MVLKNQFNTLKSRIGSKFPSYFRIRNLIGQGVQFQLHPCPGEIGLFVTFVGVPKSLQCASVQVCHVKIFTISQKHNSAVDLMDTWVLCIKIVQLCPTNLSQYGGMLLCDKLP